MVHPSREEEREVLDRALAKDKAQVEQVLTPEDLIRAQDAAAGVYTMIA